LLTIYEIACPAADAKRYYSTADYYSQGQETVGLWGGILARALGLEGKVKKDDFDRMVDNLHPDSGEQLTPRMKDNRRIGYDFTVSLNKSASILRAFAGEADAKALDAARDRAIAKMMGMVESDMQTRVRIGGKDADRTTGNLAYAAFHHTTSRPVDGQPPDMNEHTHLLVFNVTHDPVENRRKAGQFAGLKRDGEFYSAVFDAFYAAELERLGFHIERQGGKKWKVAGITDHMVDTFSKRKDEIEDAAARLGITDPARKGELAATTRSKKRKELTPDELRVAWLAQLGDDDRDALVKVYGREIDSDRQVTPAEAAAFAIAHLSEQQSAFPERELVRVALLHGLGDVTLEEIREELPRQGVILDVIDDRLMATTESLQAEERYIAAIAGRGLGAVRPVGVADGLERGRLNDGQWEVTRGLLESSNRVSLVEGPAGAGKTTMLAAYDSGMRLAGESVTYLATTTQAAKVLGKDGFSVKTVAHFLLDEKMQAAARGGRVVIDESSMLGHKDAVKLFQVAERNNLKLIFVGDPMQHGSVPRGAFLRTLKEQGRITPFKLTEIMRQHDLEYRAAAQALSEGKTLDGFNALDKKGWVHEIGDDAARYRAMAADYLQAVGRATSCLVVSPTHREAASITAEIRSQLRQAGKLGAEERQFTRLVAVDASEAQRGLATTYRQGDVIQFHQNAKGGFTKGERMIVDDPATVPLSEAEKFTLYRLEAVGLSVGDKIRFTGNVKAYKGDDHTYKNGDTLTVAGFTPGGNLRLDDGRVVRNDAGHFRHAFVETSFGAQGQTVQRVILGMSAASLGATNQEQMYVSASRAREKLALFTDDREAVKRAIQRSSQKVAALDLMPEREAAPKRSRLLRDHLERQRRLAGLNLRQKETEPTPPRPTPEPSRRFRLPPAFAERAISEQQGRGPTHGR
jgi:conjugative relaxase-like TrwC/TraI family protein